MRTVSLSKPELGFLAVTRGLLGAGLGLLVASRLSRHARRVTGWTLFAVGAVTTVPLMAIVFRDRRPR